MEAKFKPPGISSWLPRAWITIYWLTALSVHANATRCHICSFQLARCVNPLDCYNQPDTCSNTNFSPLFSTVETCEFGCEQHIIIDATGSTVLWRRGCASPSSPKSSHICLSRNIHFFRHEQCWCHTDYCNSSRTNFSLEIGLPLSLTLMLIIFIAFRHL